MCIIIYTMVSNNNPHSEDDSFAGAFGGAFGGAFEVKFNSDGSTSKVAASKETQEEPAKKSVKKTKKPEETTVKKELRSSSRTFAAATNSVVVKAHKQSEHPSETWIKDLSFAYEKSKQTQSPDVEPVKVTQDQSVVKQAHVPTHAAPTPFKSKIITAEERKRIQDAANAAKLAATPTPAKTAASNDRGTAFAKTFLRGSGVAHKPRPSSNSSYKPPFATRSYEPRVRRTKVKNAPTLKTRVSGKSNANVLQLKKEVGTVVQTKAPVVVIMGHVDHGKSTLLDYIRKANTTDKEAGGITQKMSAYEIVHNGQHITFLDTPGHEAFNSMRTRGARAADIAVLVVSAEDGVKPQTLDALKSITEAGVPYCIGASKMDRPEADIEKTKQSLAENNIFVEGYGGDISLIPFSGKVGTGVDDLLDMILLMAEVADIQAAVDVPAVCLVIESGRDKIRGIHATLIVKDGTLTTGSFIVSGGEISPVRIMENFESKAIKKATPGQPVRLVGWSASPHVGDICIMCKTKEEAELVALEQKEVLTLAAQLDGRDKTKPNPIVNIRAMYGLERDDTWTLPLVLKADSVGTLDAVKQEVAKISLDRITIKVIRAETGDINENDIKLAQGSKDSIVLGYNTKIDAQARRLAESQKTTIETFDIIYKLTEWVTEEAKKRAPKVTSEESHGQLKILKTFSINKNKQVLGGRVETGRLNLGDMVKIIRRENEIGQGTIVELQQARSAVKTVEAENECGLMVESKIEIASGDVLSAVSIVER